MSNTNIAQVLTEDVAKALKDDAATARKDGRLEIALAPFWDSVVEIYGFGEKGSEHPRANIISGVLTVIGEWKDTPQTDKGARTPFGNVVQKFGARYDAAVKRAKPEEPKAVVLRAVLSGEGGGSTTIPEDHPLYAEIVALIAGSTETTEEA